MKTSLWAGLAAGMAIPAYGVNRRYRCDMSAARARLAAVERRVISTPWGAVEYAERGSGSPVLVVHGIYQHCVGGLLSVRDLFPDRRVSIRLSGLEHDVGYVIEFIDSLFPMSPEGHNFNLFVSNADVTNYNLEAIYVPTLIAHTQDDQLASHEASRRAADRIPAARFVSLTSGGHLMLGQQKKNGDILAAFFAETRDRPAERLVC